VAWGGLLDKRNFSWLALITFCSAAAVVAALALAAVFAGATLAFAAGQSAEPSHRSRANAEARTPKAFSGVITDSHCGARHTMSDKNSAECSRACVWKGARYVLVNGDRVYALNGNEAVFEKLAGQRVTAEGTVTGDAITIRSVTGR
jgi:hypothetical protein